MLFVHTLINFYMINAIHNVTVGWGLGWIIEHILPKYGRKTRRNPPKNNDKLVFASYIKV